MVFVYACAKDGMDNLFSLLNLRGTVLTIQFAVNGMEGNVKRV